MSDTNLLQRKSPVHLPLRALHNRATIVLVTVCTDKRKRILAHEDVHRLLIEAWNKADAWLVGRYVVLPDHIHLFCAPNQSDAPTLGSWVHFWKSLVSQRWPRPAEQPIWQKSLWDTQLREADRYGDKWEYVRHNPVRHGLVTSPEQWVFQGELHVLEWHD